jgi:hydrogenase maturation protein HypF
MLPYSPLHQLLLQTWNRPLVMTSGNLSEEPQCVDNADAAARLGGLADWLLLHDREILNRLDDSVVQLVDGAPRMLRRARGFAPRPLALPQGFAGAPQLLALGGDLKSTFCLLMDGRAILSQHLGDLEDARTAAEFQRAIDLYLRLFQHQPRHLVVDRHADYHSSRMGRRWADRDGLPLQRVQHHHAHIASVLADNGWGLRDGEVLGIALDGLGLGDDGTLWGGEFLIADYREFQRVGWLLPVPMPGGTRAILEPWRNTYAQLHTCLGWDRVIRDWPQLELTQWLQTRPLEIVDGMLKRRLNCPLSSSCGRLFDAVAGALGIAREAISYEGEAAVALEALARRASPAPAAGYPLKVDRRGAAWVLDPTPLWPLLLQDLQRGREPGQIALAFHLGLGAAISAMAATLARHHAVSTVALSGGVFQNRLLFEAVARDLRSQRLQVLSHSQFPTNDGGLALGQATIAAARLLS